MGVAAQEAHTHTHIYIYIHTYIYIYIIEGSLEVNLEGCTHTHVRMQQPAAIYKS